MWQTVGLTRQQHDKQQRRHQHAGESGSPPCSHDFTSWSPKEPDRHEKWWRTWEQFFPPLKWPFSWSSGVLVTIETRCSKLQPEISMQNHILPVRGWRIRMWSLEVHLGSNTVCVFVCVCVSLQPFWQTALTGGPGTGFKPNTQATGIHYHSHWNTHTGITWGAGSWPTQHSAWLVWWFTKSQPIRSIVIIRQENGKEPEWSGWEDSGFIQTLIIFFL